MPKKKDRIIIDTNPWISFLLTNEFSKPDNIFAKQSAKLLFSAALPEEFIATHLITGDKDLLDIREFGKTKIITITDYLAKR